MKSKKRLSPSDEIRKDIERRMGCLESQLEDAVEHLDWASAALEDAQEEVYTWEDRVDEISRDLDELKKEYDEELNKIRCPKCGTEFTEEYIASNLQEDTFGEVWRCPNKSCDFGGYRAEGEGRAMSMFKEMKAIWNERKREYLEKNFKKIHSFIHDS